MPKRFSKNKAKPGAQNPVNAAAQTRPEPVSSSATERSAKGGAAAVADTESEFSVPQKWEENEQENATASSGPASAARDGESSEEAADAKPQ